MKEQHAPPLLPSEDANDIAYSAMVTCFKEKKIRLEKEEFKTVLHALRHYLDGDTARYAASLVSMLHHQDLSGEHFDKKIILKHVKLVLPYIERFREPMDSDGLE